MHKFFFQGFTNLMADQYERPVYTQAWFWFLAVGILIFSIGVIIYDVRSTLDNTWWVLVMIIGGTILMVTGFLLAIFEWWSRENGVKLDLFPMESIALINEQPQQCEQLKTMYSPPAILQNPATTHPPRTRPNPVQNCDC